MATAIATATAPAIASSAAAPVAVGDNGQPLFTCLSCNIAFPNAHDQRTHYRTDWHRYNAKRRVAQLPPIRQDVFNQKVAAASSSSASSSAAANASASSSAAANATEEEINALIDAKLASATRIDPVSACLFCTAYTPPSPPSIDATIEHMQRAHGFFIPEREYLIDLPGLLTYLADKITVGNICLYCNARGKSFASLEAVRKHMLDKSHCKIAYTAEDDIMELSDFYDFSSSYPDYEEEGDAEWEDMDGVEEEDAGDDEDVEMDGSASASASAPTSKKTNSAANKAQKKTSGAQYGDTEYELVLPSGVRIGHRALRRYYNQTFWTTPATQTQEADAGILSSTLLRNRRLITASDSGVDPAKRALIIPNRGGKQNAIVARSKGQAREATRHVREFRDVQRREAYKTRVAYTNNNQKHFRDPLLQ